MKNIFPSILVCVLLLSVHCFCKGILHETENRFASRYEFICWLAVFGYSALGAHCGKISDLGSNSILALTFFFFTEVDVIDIGVIRSDLVVST